MNLLLDTCASIWWDSGGGSLSPVATAALQDTANRLHLSHASLWEMQLKHQRGKLLFTEQIFSSGSAGEIRRFFSDLTFGPFGRRVGWDETDSPLSCWLERPRSADRARAHRPERTAAL